MADSGREKMNAIVTNPAAGDVVFSLGRGEPDLVSGPKDPNTWICWVGAERRVSAIIKAER